MLTAAHAPKPWDVYSLFPWPQFHPLSQFLGQLLQTTLRCLYNEKKEGKIINWTDSRCCGTHSKWEKSWVNIKKDYNLITFIIFEKIRTGVEWLITYRGTGQSLLEHHREQHDTFADFGVHLFKDMRNLSISFIKLNTIVMELINRFLCKLPEIFFGGLQNGNIKISIRK